MKNSLETRLGIFVALAVIAAVLILETIGGIERFQRGYHVNAEFNNIQDLKEGDRVKMAGVEVGRVEKIALDETNNKVRVTLKLKKDVIVKTDSTARIKFAGLLGQNYVSLDFGTGSVTATNDALLATSEQPDLNKMMEKLDNVASGIDRMTRNFSGDKIDNLLGPFTDFLKANREPLTTSIANLRAISTQITKGEGTMGRLIYDDALYNSTLASVSNMNSVASDIKLAVGDARNMLDEARNGNGTIGKLVKDDALYRESVASMSSLHEILEKINKGNGSVGKLVNDDEFLRNAKLSLQKIDKATEGLEDQGPLSVLGLVVNKLF
jgi:phospholipid/cholesterol/gamma-HCH transport system substrate-binding protein